jgi:hypothetical protein
MKRGKCVAIQRRSPMKGAVITISFILLLVIALTAVFFQNTISKSIHPTVINFEQILYGQQQQPKIAMVDAAGYPERGNPILT